MANFNNVDDLDPLGSTLFAPNLESGAALAGTPGQNGFGSLVAGSLELSTVELAREFVSLTHFAAGVSGQFAGDHHRRANVQHRGGAERVNAQSAREQQCEILSGKRKSKIYISFNGGFSWH